MTLKDATFTVCSLYRSVASTGMLTFNEQHQGDQTHSVQSTFLFVHGWNVVYRLTLWTNEEGEKPQY